MPRVELVFFREASGKAPVVHWLEDLRRRDRKAYAKTVAAIERLAEWGHELRRPIADYLRGGIYELRVNCGHVNYRILYFFNGRLVAVLTSALTKEGVVPPAEIKRAISRRQMFQDNPGLHTHEETAENNRQH